MSNVICASGIKTFLLHQNAKRTTKKHPKVGTSMKLLYVVSWQHMKLVKSQIISYVHLGFGVWPPRLGKRHHKISGDVEIRYVRPLRVDFSEIQNILQGCPCKAFVGNLRPAGQSYLGEEEFISLTHRILLLWRAFTVREYISIC